MKTLRIFKYLLIAKLLLITICIGCTKDEPTPLTNADLIIGEWEWYEAWGSVDSFGVWEFTRDSFIQPSGNASSYAKGWYQIGTDTLILYYNPVPEWHSTIIKLNEKELILDNIGKFKRVSGI